MKRKRLLPAVLLLTIMLCWSNFAAAIGLSTSPVTKEELSDSAARIAITATGETLADSIPIVYKYSMNWTLTQGTMTESYRWDAEKMQYCPSGNFFTEKLERPTLDITIVNRSNVALDVKGSFAVSDEIENADLSVYMHNTYVATEAGASEMDDYTVFNIFVPSADAENRAIGERIRETDMAPEMEVGNTTSDTDMDEGGLSSKDTTISGPQTVNAKVFFALSSFMKDTMEPEEPGTEEQEDSQAIEAAREKVRGQSATTIGTLTLSVSGVTSLLEQDNALE